ncbi:MAG: hypothetical protein GWO24_33025, partial [Akkermansiaceae bacterium]|nr:hypothetical protein [Akkermansiaceae bacterium]
RVARKDGDEAKEGGEKDQTGEAEPEKIEAEEVVDWQNQPDLETVFVRQRGRWVVDWEAFVRYSTESWERFVKQAGDTGGIFRVYMRQGLKIETEGTPVVKVQ